MPISQARQPINQDSKARRRAWQAPSVARIRAGAAENGGRFGPEGGFS